VSFLLFSVAAAMVVTYIMLILTARGQDSPVFAYLVGLLILAGGILHALGM
jgi:hypothetical protein